MQYGVWGVCEAHVADAILAAVEELVLGAGMHVVDVDRVIVTGSDQQVF